MTKAVRYVSAVILGCLYSALVVWLVGSEGRSYRDSIRLERDRGEGVGTEDPMAAVTSPPAPALLKPQNSPLPSPSRKIVVKTEPVEAPRTTVSPKAAPPPPRPATAGPKPEFVAAAIGPKPVTPTFIGPSGARRSSMPNDRPPSTFSADSLDLARLTPEQEARLGAELNELVLTGNPVDRGGDLQRLRRAAGPLIATVARKEVEYRFTVLDSDEVNAFSLPGGYVYVSSGLFRLVGESAEPEQDYALQFALGHEIAHVDLKHDLELVARNNASVKAKGDALLKLFMVPIGVGYPDAQEFAADAWTYQRMTGRIDRTRREALMFLIRLQGHAERTGYRNGREVPEPKSGLTLVENHYRSHPAAWDRLDRLKALAIAPVGLRSQSR